MRPIRPDARIRRVTRSTTATSAASVSTGPRSSAAYCDPNERRRPRGRTGRGSISARDRVDVAAGRLAEQLRRASFSPSRATSPIVASPRPRSFRAVAAPTPQSRSSGSGCRNSSSPPAGTTSRPSGFAERLATFATTLLDATPTVTASPTSARTSRRSRAAIAAGEPAIRSSPRTSRNASSIETPSTSGAVRSNTPNSARLAAT